MNVRLTEAQKITVLNAHDVYSVMQQILLRQNKIRRAQEHFWVVGLKADNTILFVELIAIGAQNRVNANPPDVFRMGIYKLAVRVILVHNHPSGNLKPSAQDKDITDRLLKVGKLINIDVIDHLIITESGFTSFKDKGIMEELRKSGLYEIQDRESDQMKEMQLRYERKNAEKAKALEVARRLKEMGMDTDFIKKATGLYVRDIKGA
ncbi:JAB domain-containing protein [Kordia algicida OT-1]|uniref:DNA repair protein n=1 Tax=Kordia algicida OT-1 TaxID=391587 RepID=A9DI55_9FLAO|nr:JAB domain-containing protein [Kordia algicida]EDP97840.1 DNA repair protein [Kordia algicida OT-1]